MTNISNQPAFGMALKHKDMKAFMNGLSDGDVKLYNKLAKKVHRSSNWNKTDVFFSPAGENKIAANIVSKADNGIADSCEFGFKDATKKETKSIINTLKAKFKRIGTIQNLDSKFEGAEKATRHAKNIEN
ncbi:MAG: hypothetical protein PHV37_05405 [Candidatus Gastranaerophilales bacterium]|nr:hypothetical protein [Candidatus Gastranaerophilales bacterium]